MVERKIGEVTHYFTNISVAGIELSGTLNVGDTIRIKGATTDFKQAVASIQVEGEDVESAGAGTEIGLKVESRAREGDAVYRIE